jgi:CDP-glucose 4,6-dehydratase
MDSVIGDILDRESLERSFKEFRPEIVIHMAAQPIVRASYDDPVGTYGINVMGTVHLLEAIRQTGGVKSVVMITTDKVYENREWVWSYREKSALGGDDPYSNSKACSELVVYAYRKSFFNAKNYGQHGVAMATARAGNVIGGGDWAQDRLVPDTMKMLMEGRSIELRYPNSTRPWQHVLEPLNGYLVLAQRLYEFGTEFNGAWNFGPYESISITVAEIVEKLYALWGAPLSWQRDKNINPHESLSLRLDSAKARALLNWRPKLDTDTMLQWIVDWYRVLQSGGDIRAFTQEQTRRFIAARPHSPH